MSEKKKYAFEDDEPTLSAEQDIFDSDSDVPVRPFDERFLICDLMTIIGYADFKNHPHLASICSFDLLMAWMDGKFQETYTAWKKYLDEGKFKNSMCKLTMRHGMKVPPIGDTFTQVAERLEEQRYEKAQEIRNRIHGTNHIAPQF